MKKLLLATALCVGATPAFALFGTDAPGWVYMIDPTTTPGTILGSASHPVNVAGSFSATLSGFTPTPSYSQLAFSDAINHSVATPSGVDDVISNLDTNVAYCNFGAVSTNATFPIPAGATFGFHNGGAFATLQCISPTSSLKITISGGAGLFTGGGGGGGGGGSGSNASVSATGSAPPASATYAGMLSGGNLVGIPGTTHGQTIDTDSSGNLYAAVTGPLPNPNSAAAWGLLAQGSTTSAELGQLMMGAVTTGAPTYTTAQSSPLSLDTAGNLRVNVVTGGGAGGTSSTFGSTFPGTGTAIGLSNGSNMVALTQGQTTMSASVPVAIASNQSNLPTNTAQVNGVTTLTGTGAVGTGAQRVAVGTDTATIAGSAPSTVLQENNTQWGGTAITNVPTAVGTAGTGNTPTVNAYIVGGAGSGGTAGADAATFTAGTTNMTPEGCEFTSGGATALVTGHMGMVGCTAARAQFTDKTSVGGTALSAATSAYGTAPTGTVVEGVNAFVTNTNSNGQTTMSASSPVVIASDQSAIATKAASGAFASGSIASGALSSGSIASGAAVSGAFATGAITDLAIAQAATTSGKVGNMPLASVTTSAPSYTTGQLNPLSLDTAGNLRVNVVTGGGAGGTSAADASAWTAGTTSQTPIGCEFTSGGATAIVTAHMGTVGCTAARAALTDVSSVNGVTTLTGTGAVGTGAQRVAVGTDTATIAGSAPGTAGTASTNVLSVQGIASMTPLLANPGTASNWGVLAQNATTSGELGELMMGAVTTGAPTYTTAQTSALSLDTAGNLRTSVTTVPSGAIAAGASAGDPCMYGTKTNLAISTNATSLSQIIALSGTTKIYICSLVLVAPGATAFSLVYGTGTNCASGPVAVIGANTAANGMSFAANGGITIGNGSGVIGVSAAGNALCTLQTNAVQVAGNLTYVQQ